jgi:hypothetical protein
MNDKQRTVQQNKALHLWFQMLADSLNDAGYDMRKTLKQEIEIPWTKSSIKEYIWRPIQEAQLGKKSTTDLTTTEIDRVLETITRHIAKFGITEPFPSVEELMLMSEFDKLDKD